MFARKKGPEVEIDDLCRYAPAHAAAAAAAAGDLATVAAAMHGTTGQARNLVTEAVARNLPLGAAYQWTSDAPRSADAWVARAAAEAFRAKEVRGGGMAETLKDGQILGFQQLMANARTSAEYAASLDATDAEAMSRLVMTAYAHGLDGLWDTYAELHRRDPEHLWGHLTMVDLLGEKWFGRPEEARTLAETLAADAPEGSLLPAVVAAAVREQWLYLTAFAKDKRGTAAFLADPRTRASVSSAVRRSVDSPAHTPQPLAPVARNVFALTFHLLDDRDASAAQLVAAGDIATEHPWNVLRGTETWRKARGI
jgi:hypothetical protein